jgi:hypothetical protein
MKQQKLKKGRVWLNRYPAISNTQQGNHTPSPNDRQSYNENEESRGNKSC